MLFRERDFVVIILPVIKKTKSNIRKNNFENIKT